MRMFLPLFSASSASRVSECPASAALPHINDSSEDAERGTALHKFCRDVLSGVAREIAAMRVPEQWRGTAERLDFAGSIGDLVGIRPEVSVAVHVHTGAARELGQNLNRKYLVDDDEVPGTHDIEGRTSLTGRLVTGDWKTGQEVDACEVNWQSRFAARCLATIHGVPEVEARILYIRESGKVWVDRHVFDSFALDTFLDELAEAYDRAVQARETVLAGVVPTVHPGSHCKYCGALPICPAHVSLARCMTGEAEAIHGRLAMLTPEAAGEAWRKLKSIETIVDTVKEGLKMYARQTAIPLSATKEVRELIMHKAYFSKEKAIALLREKGATDEELAGLETLRDESQIREMNRKLIGGPVKALPRKRSSAA